MSYGTFQSLGKDFSMCPVTQIFGISVSTYSIMIIIGFAAGLVCAVLRRKINEIRADDLVACLFIAAAGALLGGKLFYMIQGFPQFLGWREKRAIRFSNISGMRALSITVVLPARSCLYS